MIPNISIIITTRNSARTLNKCLKSLSQQTYKKIEIIVVDNNSTDNTKKIARKYTSKVYNKGPERSAQRNYGVFKAKGNYVLVHDSDIYFHKNSVKECIKLADNKNAKAIILPEKSIGSGFWTKVKAFERSFYVGNDLIEAVRFFERKIYLEVGGYDENLTACEDWDLTNKIRAKQIKIFRTNSSLLHDEGKLNLFGSSSKKKYYAKWIKTYKNRYPEISKKQFSFFSRFTFDKLIIKGLCHPILMCSMILMKGMEWLNAK